MKTSSISFIHVGMLKALIFLSLFSVVARAADVDVQEFIRRESEISAKQGRSVYCLMGYQSCLLAFDLLERKALPATEHAAIAVVPSYGKSLEQDQISLFDLVSLLKLNSEPLLDTQDPLAPEWAVPTEQDRKLYNQIWQDGELHVTLLMGYRDLGVGENPNTFVYGTYAQALDMIRKFSGQWGLEWTRVDEIESIGKVKISANRTVYFKIIDPHLFCKKEQQRIDQIEKNQMTRDASGFIRSFSGKATLERDLKCDRQAWASGEAKKRFFATLADPKQDIVFYNGHSRRGTGPDFGYYSGKAGKVRPKDLIKATVASNASVIYFNGCSGEKNYGSFIEQATKSGKTVAWNELAPNMLDADEDLLLFTQSIFEGRALSAIERFMNLTQAFGTWPNMVKISRPTDE